MFEVARRAVLDEVALLLCESEQRSWYPGRFFDPVEDNEPHLTHAVEAFERAVQAASTAGMPLSRIALVGFSQGACVLTELLRRRPRAYGGAAVLTGALMGEPPPDGRLPPPPDGMITGLRIHFSASRHDEWIPLEHALAASRYFQRAGAHVTTAVSDEADHDVSHAEATSLRRLVDELLL